MADYQLDKTEARVAFLMDHIPQTRHDYLSLIVTYWSMFDGINIPSELLQEIINKGSKPESITRARRKVTERLRLKEYLELQRMAQVEVKVKAPLNQGGHDDRREKNEGP